MNLIFEDNKKFLNILLPLIFTVLILLILSIFSNILHDRKHDLGVQLQDDYIPLPMMLTTFSLKIFFSNISSRNSQFLKIHNLMLKPKSKCANASSEI